MEELEEGFPRVVKRSDLRTGDYYLPHIDDELPKEALLVYHNETCIRLYITTDGDIRVDRDDSLDHVILISEEKYKQIINKQLGL